MCKNNNYLITISGDRDDRERLAGRVVMFSANLVTGLKNNTATVAFYFRYKSDAKLVLRNVSKSLRVKLPTSESMNFGKASARIQKVA